MAVDCDMADTGNEINAMLQVQVQVLVTMALAAVDEGRLSRQFHRG